MVLDESRVSSVEMEPVEAGQRISAVDRLVEQIRDLVRERGLGIGDQLPTERELGERFQAGRNTVREALQILKAYGIVEVRPKVGAVLSGQHEDAVRKLFAFQNEISPASFLDVQGFRRIIEVGVGDHLILNATAEDLDRLEAINAALIDNSDVEEAARVDFAFHEALVDMAGNKMLSTNYRLLQPLIVQIMRVGKSQRPAQVDTYQAHLEIIRALRDRDRVAYAYLVSRHLEYGLQYVNGS